MKDLEKKQRYVYLAAFMMLLFIVFVRGGARIKMSHDTLRKPATSESDVIVFLVTADDTLDTIAERLEGQGIVRSKKFFKKTIQRSTTQTIKPGNYFLDRSSTYEELANQLTNPENKVGREVDITFLPNDWAKDFAFKIGSITNLKADDILASWSDPVYLKSLSKDYPFLTEAVFNPSLNVGLEGYFTPETYRFFTQTTVDAVTRRLLDQTLAFYQEHKALFESQKLSIHEIYTLASIINFETENFDDMKRVSGVFYNRLQSEMPLQSSVTVCYALYEYETWQQCESNTDIDSKFNTYQHLGLPIGPVMNPSQNALLAAMEPEKHQYYYFVGDMKHHDVYFAETLSEHEYNVETYVDPYR